MAGNKFRRILAALIIVSPLTAYAHGEEVILTLFIEFILVVVFIGVLLTIKLKGQGKLIIAGLYLLTTILTFISFDSLPYKENATLINLALAIIPWTVFLLSYFVLRRRFMKER